MSSEYRTICDFCGKETKCFSSQLLPASKEFEENQWSVRIYSHWLEDKEEFKELNSRIEFEADACLDCAQRASAVLRELRTRTLNGE